MDRIIIDSLGSIAKKIPGAKKIVQLGEPAMPYVRAANCVLSKFKPDWKYTRNLQACTSIYDEITQ